jgi:hypothetical protein
VLNIKGGKEGGLRNIFSLGFMENGLSLKFGSNKFVIRKYNMKQKFPLVARRGG